MTAKRKKKTETRGRKPEYPEVSLAVSTTDIKKFFTHVKNGEPVMLSLGGKQLGQFLVKHKKGYLHVSGADGSKRKLPAFKRLKFIPAKDIKDFLKTL